MGYHYQRQTLQLRAATAGANAGDTGPLFAGELMQIRWVPTTPDTGADLVLTMLGDVGDTGGLGFVFYNNTDCLGVQFTHSPRQQAHNSVGDPVDTGEDFPQPIVASGGRIRAKAVAGGNAAVAGTLHVWTRS